MHDDAFEWDERKAAENDAKHGVTFETARVAFTDPFAIDWLDRSEDYGEDRFAIVGMVEGRLINCCLHSARRENSADLRAAC